MLPEIKSAYLLAEGYESQLEQELAGIVGRHGRLFFSDQPPQNVFWAQNIWHNPQTHEIESINHAVRTLKQIQRNWCCYAKDLHRRSALIQEKLPHISAKPVVFPSPLPKATLGSWTLLDKNTLLASPQCSSAFLNGEIYFEEDKTGPPNRAYLKLWEAFTLMESCPKQGEFCIDAGGSPGGWAWTVAKLGARVLSVDRAPLDEKVMNLKEVEFEQGNAFNKKPEDFEKVDWLICDVVCYPEKLLDWVIRWVESGKAQHMIATIKFQGEADYSIAKRFAAIPGSKVQHLFHNKHELTWMWKREG
ncbi:MAG: hypothetical protein G3M70_14760 [Candidatus Nitronauta litoralis]|uniref:Ribosomal RNA methyltransferase FtsJ domain-containing protein n=1 Tax=Candidatus Nitronauta litoralis TaxID=2705533 RepID=A0A7T0BYX1_9BACT|nr:MAG: hypothetical protein G3M70_14760 [Candidatus Nitronauta litoralis]